LGSEGSLTIIRDDGYSRPFVGACALNSSGSVERAFEEYYRISEQLPTHIAASIGFTPEGTCAYAGTVVLQPLPFADEETLKKIPARKRLEEIAASVKALGLEKAAEIYFSAKSAGLNLRKAEYKCNCSKEYLSGVLVSLGKDQLKDILREDGEIKVHCHYCNKDYRFTEEDVEKMFP
ncbi:MAG: Hsp33 family molecular chaperone HslO, partial [Coriobacteriales bacterium]